jgi:hypothetical protein
MNDWLKNAYFDYKKIPYLYYSKSSRENSYYEQFTAICDNLFKKKNLNGKNLYELLCYEEIDNNLITNIDKTQAILSIKNWLSYKIFNIFFSLNNEIFGKLNKNKFKNYNALSKYKNYLYDCESSSEAKEVYKILGWNNEYYDNINSFQTIWNHVLSNPKLLDKNTNEDLELVTNNYYDKNKKIYEEYEEYSRDILSGYVSKIFLAIDQKEHFNFKQLYNIEENRMTSPLFQDVRYISFNEGYVKKLAVKLWQISSIDTFDIKEDIIIELGKLSYLTHTIGNFMPCPRYYNKAKGCNNNCDDRIDLFINYINNPQNIGYVNDKQALDEKNKIDIINWFNKDNILKYKLTDYFENDSIKSISNNFKRTKYMEHDEMLRYLKKVNALIENRCDEIQKLLNRS